ncbi:SNF1-related protein kinase regulatory subunit beta-3 [Amaranthus tricolor]|uniref:SNF1-related protein kinase regulatory subunit beta-3 n=1 Tax=Amaranthus tricolor TaxID=29722 RepID=UPI0025826F46|nr:SNF1-related protein kinase regulatory subunit beta-3 [Amaranthus tricolor]
MACILLVISTQAYCNGYQLVSLLSFKVVPSKSFSFCETSSLGYYFFNMSTAYNEEQEQGTVVGFETPKSPSSSYTNVYPGNEDEARDPPLVPPHLQHTLLSCPASRETTGTFPLPQNVILNHLYIENREAPRSVVALGFTHRFRSKFVTVVLYKPVQRRGSNA